MKKSIESLIRILKIGISKIKYTWKVLKLKWKKLKITIIYYEINIKKCIDFFKVLNKYNFQNIMVWKDMYNIYNGDYKKFIKKECIIIDRDIIIKADRIECNIFIIESGTVNIKGNVDMTGQY